MSGYSDSGETLYSIASSSLIVVFGVKLSEKDNSHLQNEVEITFLKLSQLEKAWAKLSLSYTLNASPDFF
jgi:hypothetical protein